MHKAYICNGAIMQKNCKCVCVCAFSACHPTSIYLPTIKANVGGDDDNDDAKNIFLLGTL